jgi:hypothetical protein
MNYFSWPSPKISAQQWFGELGEKTLAALARAICWSSFATFNIALLYMSLFELFGKGNSVTFWNLVFWSPVILALSALLSFLIAGPILLYASLTALPLYKLLILRRRITLYMCILSGVCLSTPIPLFFGVNDAVFISFFAFAGLTAGTLFYRYDQVLPKRRAAGASSSDASSMRVT